MRESQIAKYLGDRVKALGGEIRKVQFIGHRGAPDRFVLIPGKPRFWVEVKAPGEKAQPHQIREHNKLRRMGEIIEVLDSIEAIDGVLA